MSEMDDMNVVSVVAVQIIAVGAIAIALVLYLLTFKRPCKLTEIGNRSVFVTCCDTPIGYECARRYDRLGLRVFAGFVGGIETPSARKLREESSRRLHVVHFDPNSCEKLDKAVEYVHRHLPTDENGLWALVNTTSECIGGLLERLSFDQCERQIHVNLVSAIRLTKAFLPLLKKRKGRLVSLIGLGGQPCYPGFAVYASCKAGIESFFEALRYEMQRYDVRFVTVSPTIQYQFEQTRDVADVEADAPIGHRPGFGSDPKVCVLDKKTRDAVLMDLEDAVLSTRPLPQYVSSPIAQKRLVNYLPENWKRQKLARDFQSNFLIENTI